MQAGMRSFRSAYGRSAPPISAHSHAYRSLHSRNTLACHTNRQPFPPCYSSQQIRSSSVYISPLVTVTLKGMSDLGSNHKTVISPPGGMASRVSYWVSCLQPQNRAVSGMSIGCSRRYIFGAGRVLHDSPGSSVAPPRAAHV